MRESWPSMEIVLVHGTFARGAAWTLDSSPLCRALKERFGENLLFSRFVWSGQNSFRARDEATARLRQFITERNAAPVGHRFIVAHSHGGNIAFEALSGPHAAGEIDGLVCLSTPFLLQRARSIPALVEVLITVVGIAAAVIALLCLLTIPVVVAIIPLAGMFLAFPGNGLAGLIGLSAGLYFAVLTFRKLADVLSEFRIRPFTVAGPEPPLLDPKKLLILQSAGDEAAAALAAPRLANRLATVAFVRPLEALAAYIQRAFAAWERWPHPFLGDLSEPPSWATTSILAIAGFGLLALLLGFVGLERIAVLLIMAGGILGAALTAYEFGPFLLLCAVGVLASLVALPLMVLFFLAFLPFGYDTALVSLFFEVDANTTPPGTWTVRLIPATPRFLAHSATYDSSTAVLAVTEWISSRVGGDILGAG